MPKNVIRQKTLIKTVIKLIIKTKQNNIETLTYIHAIAYCKHTQMNQSKIEQVATKPFFFLLFCLENLNIRHAYDIGIYNISILDEF